jgi:hypothetical protein
MASCRMVSKAPTAAMNLYTVKTLQILHVESTGEKTYPPFHLKSNKRLPDGPRLALSIIVKSETGLIVLHQSHFHCPSADASGIMRMEPPTEAKRDAIAPKVIPNRHFGTLAPPNAFKTPTKPLKIRRANIQAKISTSQYLDTIWLNLWRRPGAFFNSVVGFLF